MRRGGRGEQSVTEEDVRLKRRSDGRRAAGKEETWGSGPRIAERPLASILNSI